MTTRILSTVKRGQRLDNPRRGAPLRTIPRPAGWTASIADEARWHTYLKTRKP